MFLYLTDLCKLAADSTFGFEARFGRILLVFICTQAACAAELLERFAGVDLRHDGTLHIRDVPEKQKCITGHRLISTRKYVVKCVMKMRTLIVSKYCVANS